jgi:hypothetical protein
MIRKIPSQFSVVEPLKDHDTLAPSRAYWPTIPAQPAVEHGTRSEKMRVTALGKIPSP